MPLCDAYYKTAQLGRGIGICEIRKILSGIELQVVLAQNSAPMTASSRRANSIPGTRAVRRRRECRRSAGWVIFGTPGAKAFRIEAFRDG